MLTRWLWVGCLIWYPLLIWLLGFTPYEHLDFGLAFNSMAEHLLHGRFDVDPDAIGAEGFDIGDRTVSYFGIFCAVLRIPLVLLPGLARTDVTWWSCLIAVWIAIWFQMRAIALVGGTQNRLAAALMISVVLGGQHIQFLRPSIYQEPINWAFAQAMAFVFLAIRGLMKERFDQSTLCWMAVCSGLALLTRVSFGVGLYAASGFFLIARGRPREWPMPVCILLLFMVLAGIVNEGRWGNPFTFADFSRFDLSQDANPDRLGRIVAYGAFNPERIWLTLGYYFLPVWIWVRSDGHVLFAESQATLMDAMELPPGSFFLTDSFLLGLAVAGVVAVRDRGRAALLLGLGVQPILMLCAIATAHRYRAEFYPFLFLAALFGLSRRANMARRLRIAVIATVALGVVASHAMLWLDARSPRGPGEVDLERYGVVGTFTRDANPRPR